MGLLQSSRRVCRAEGDSTITVEHLRRACELEQLDELGLGSNERRYLNILVEGSTRLNVISSVIGLAPATIQQVIEPFLVRSGLVTKDKNGLRQLTAEGWKHVKQQEAKEESDVQPTKPIVSITEMAMMCGLSYQRFAQLRRQGYFPSPLQDSETNRKFYDEELQKMCLLVRQRNMGISGKQIMFYSARRRLQHHGSESHRPKVNDKHAPLIVAVKSLGMPDVTSQQIAAAVRELFPDGVGDTPETEIVRTIFVHLMRKNCES